MYRYGLIGNCQVSALVHETGSLDWLCLPRPDSAPIFGKILDPNGGQFSITAPETAGKVTVGQRYLENTNILLTDISTPSGDSFRITDFCPRFEQHGRMYRPMSIFRIVEPLGGNPAIQVTCHPVAGWSKAAVRPVRGNSHMRYEIRDEYLRLVTNMPLTYLTEETPFHLREKLYFGLTWSASIEEDLIQVSERFLSLTTDYWRTWVKHCSIPSLFQAETIRSALALKLHCFEDTGAILAALTTSLPEERNNTRNWDYRFCWLRDAYFVLSAFHSLGHFEEMEGFLKFLLNIAHRYDTSKNRLAPVFTLSQGLPLPETIHEQWAGYEQSSPVRSNNQAAEHVQNDVYGEMVMTLGPIYFDERFFHMRSPEHEDLLLRFASSCAKTIAQPDAGLWEVRNGWQQHTFSNLMSWAGLERVQRIKNLGYLKKLSFDIGAEVKRAQAAVESAAVDGSIRNGPKDPTFDSALALLPMLRFPNLDLSRKTVQEIMRELSLGNNNESFFYRYRRKDDLGTPSSAFVVCSFWIIQALVSLQKKDEARRLLKKVITAANPLGLYSEHFLPQKSLQLGNFPQAYSHVGLINSAFAVSRPWSGVL